MIRVYLAGGREHKQTTFKGGGTKFEKKKKNSGVKVSFEEHFIK